LELDDAAQEELAQTEGPISLAAVRGRVQAQREAAAAAAPPLPLEVIQPSPSPRQQLLAEIYAELEACEGDSLTALQLAVSNVRLKL
jgi:hypothetical protein